MQDNRYRRRAEALLGAVDVRIDGDRPWDIHVHDPRFFRRALAEGSLGLGDSYMDGWWDCERLDQFYYRILRDDMPAKVRTWIEKYDVLRARLFNLQRRALAARNVQRHYDIGNDLYAAMLDHRLMYSCGYWRDAENLDQAQEHKLHLIFRKLALEPGMRVLDIGCGWGGAARLAAEAYGVEVVGVTVSKEQYQYGRQMCRGLPVDIRLMDYREVNERFDRVYSIGMFEHVGRKNYRQFFETARGRLVDDGLFLLHTIGGNRSVATIDPWILRHIFPGAMLPSIAQLGQAAEGFFVMEDWHNFGPDYDRTLMAWHSNISRRWETLPACYDKRFRRMWELYLLACAGCFRARRNQLWQIVLSPQGMLDRRVFPRRAVDRPRRTEKETRAVADAHKRTRAQEQRGQEQQAQEQQAQTAGDHWG